MPATLVYNCSLRVSDNFPLGLCSDHSHYLECFSLRYLIHSPFSSQFKFHFEWDLSCPLLKLKAVLLSAYSLDASYATLFSTALVTANLPDDLHVCCFLPWARLKSLKTKSGILPLLSLVEVQKSLGQPELGMIVNYVMWCISDLDPSRADYWRGCFLLCLNSTDTF